MKTIVVFHIFRSGGSGSTEFWSGIVKPRASPARDVTAKSETYDGLEDQINS
jgi:hypothetical protein